MTGEEIATILKTYDLDSSAVWELPQRKGTYCIKHWACEQIAIKEGIVFDAPKIVANSPDFVSIVVTGHNDKRAEWSIGECSPQNNKNAYPWAMAEKRAKDRVVLKLIGIHGQVYSEDEMPQEGGESANGFKRISSSWAKRFNMFRVLEDSLRDADGPKGLEQRYAFMLKAYDQGWICDPDMTQLKEAYEDAKKEMADWHDGE